MCRATVAGEAGVGEQLQDLLEGSKGAERAESWGGGQRPGDQQRHGVGMVERDLAEVVRGVAELALPAVVTVVGGDDELVEDKLGDAVEQGRPLSRVAVQGHGLASEGFTEAPQGQRVLAFGVDQPQGRLQDQLGA